MDWLAKVNPWQALADEDLAGRGESRRFVESPERGHRSATVPAAALAVTPENPFWRSDGSKVHRSAEAAAVVGRVAGHGANLPAMVGKK